MREFYENNAQFKEYVDKYCKCHNVTVDEALSHLIVKEVAKSYGL